MSLETSLARIRAFALLPIDKANHAVWGQLLFIAGAAFAKFIMGRDAVQVLAIGVLFSTLVMMVWEAANHRANAENPFDWSDVRAGFYGAIVSAVAAWLL